MVSVAIAIATCAGCGAINPGPVKPIVRTDSDEHFYLVKDARLTTGSPAAARKSFDHTIHEFVKLYFIPKDEKNTYTTESRWQDPSGTEFRAIRATYDKKEEAQKGIERTKGGTPRVHSIPTAELYLHKPGLWKTALYIDGKLARRLSFSVR
jgi:hypothetical protein